jgi:hypothetical protein
MIKIVGAGLAGLLAANLLRRHNPVVYEAQDALPNNHHAVLRFRSSIVGDAIGIEFKKVTVVKDVLPWRNGVADSLAYAKKNGGTYLSDRSINRSAEVVERFIAPPDLVQRMASEVDVRLGVDFDFDNEDTKVISTIPMPSLMSRLRYPGKRPDFVYRPGLVIKATIHRCDAYVSLAVPDPGFPFSRISVTGDELIVEMPGHDRSEITVGLIHLPSTLHTAARFVGIDSDDVDSVVVEAMPYAKILPIDEQDRRAFIFWASTITGRAFSLGRFAVWRPKLLMDDLVHDVKLIEKWMMAGVPGYSQDQWLARAG